MTDSKQGPSGTNHNLEFNLNNSGPKVIHSWKNSQNSKKKPFKKRLTTVKNGQYGQIGQKQSKTVNNGEKWSKTVQNGQQW